MQRGILKEISNRQSGIGLQYNSSYFKHWHTILKGQCPLTFGLLEYATFTFTDMNK